MDCAIFSFETILSPIKINNPFNASVKNPNLNPPSNHSELESSHHVNSGQRIQIIGTHLFCGTNLVKMPKENNPSNGP